MCYLLWDIGRKENSALNTEATTVYCGLVEINEIRSYVTISEYFYWIILYHERHLVPLLMFVCSYLILAYGGCLILS